jgi:hypothetical protein
MAVEKMKRSLTLVDVLGRSPSTSETIEMLVRYGQQHLEKLDEKESLEHLV